MTSTPSEGEAMLALVRAQTIEECAKIAVSFGDFPGERFVKELRVMCGNAIADKIRSLSPDTPREGER